MSVLQWFSDHVHPAAPPPPAPKPVPAPLPYHKDKISDAELKAGTKAVRDAVDESGYGSWVKDEYCSSLAQAVLVAAANVRD